MVVRKRKILMIKMLRLEGSRHCKFCIGSFPKSTKGPMLFVYIYIYIRTCIYIICTFRYSFIRPIYGQCLYYITLRTTEKTPLIFGGSQSVWGRSSCQKWVSHWQGSWDIVISLVDVVTQCKQVFRFPADLYGSS